MRFLLYPLLAAFLYTVGSLLLKRSLAHGVGPWRMTFVCNWALVLVALPLLAFAPPLGAEARWYQPVVAGTAFFVGQIFTFFAIDRGDLSVATPVLGTKVIFVALFTVLFIHIAVPWTWWLAAFLTAAALFLLGGNHANHASRRQFVDTLVWAGLAALNFSVTDVLTQKWGPAWNAFRFAPAMLGVCALLSFGLMPFFNRPLREIDPAGRRWLLGGAAVMGSQASVFYVSLGYFGHATAANVAYNSRGLWTVLLVWVVGHWFGNREREGGGGLMRRRLAGAALLLAAIALVMR